MNNQSFSPLPIALDPVWNREDFAYRSHQISQQFEQDGIKSIGLWFEDAANFACVLLACFNANVRVLLPPNILQENQQWIAENADLLLTDENFSSFGISQKQPKNRPLFERNNQTEVWLKTSGSSGEAKIIVKTAEQLWLEAETVTQILPFSSEEDVYLTGTVSVQHFYGLTYRVMLPLYRGWVIGRLQHDFPEKLIVDSQRPHKTVWISSPTLLIHLGINHPKLDKFNLIGVVTSGGVLDESEAQNISQLLNAPLIEGYGSTETGVIATKQNSKYWKVVPQAEIGVNDQGALWIKSNRVPHLEQTADAVEFYEQGFILLGRIDRIVKLGDKRVSLARIELDLNKNQLVTDSYIGLHPNHQRPLAWVQLSQEGIDLFKSKGRKAIIQLLRQHLLTMHEKFALPRYWRFSTKLPRNSQSKISRADFEQVCLAIENEQLD